MKKYEWASAELKKKSTYANYVSVLSMVGVILFYFIVPTEAVKIAHQIGLGCGAVGVISWYMAFKYQKQDKEIKLSRKNIKENNNK